MYDRLLQCICHKLNSLNNTALEVILSDLNDKGSVGAIKSLKTQLIGKSSSDEVSKTLIYISARKLEKSIKSIIDDLIASKNKSVASVKHYDK
jgi:hypothetical protein